MSGRNRGGRSTSGDRPASSPLNTGEITPELKKKIDTVQKVAPSWSTEDIIRLLERVNFNEQIAVNDIFDGIAKQPQEWSEVVSKKAKAEQTKAKTQQTKNYRDGNRNPRSNTAPQPRFNRRDEDGGERRGERGERNERGDRNDRNDRGDRSDRGDRRGTPRNRQNRENLQTTETGKSEASNVVNTQNGSSLATQTTTTEAPTTSQPVTAQVPGPVGTVGQVPVTPYKSTATAPAQSWASKASSSVQAPQRVDAPVSTVPQVKIQPAPVSTQSVPVAAIAPPIVPLMPISPVTPHVEPSTSHSFADSVVKSQSTPAVTVPTTVTSTAPASQKYQPHKQQQNWKAKDGRASEVVEPIAAPRPTATTAVTPPQSNNTATTAVSGHNAFVASVTQPVRLPAANVKAMGTAFSDNDPFQFGTVHANLGNGLPSTVAPGFPAKTQSAAPSQISHSNLAPSAPHLNEGSEESYSPSEQDSAYPKMDEHIMHNPGYAFPGHPYLFPPNAYFNPESERVNYMEQFYGAQGETSAESKYPAPGFSSFPRDSTKFSGETSPQGQSNPQYYPHTPMYYHYPPNQFQFPGASQYYRTPMMYQSGPYRGGYPNTPYNQTPSGYPDDMGAFDKNYPAPGFENGSSAAPLQQGQTVQKLQNPSHTSTQSKAYSGQAMAEGRDGTHAKNPMTQYTHNHNYNYLQQGYPSPSNYSYPQTGNAGYPNTRQGSSNNF